MAAHAKNKRMITTNAAGVHVLTNDSAADVTVAEAGGALVHDYTDKLWELVCLWVLWLEILPKSIMDTFFHGAPSTHSGTIHARAPVATWQDSFTHISFFCMEDWRLQLSISGQGYGSLSRFLSHSMRHVWLTLSSFTKLSGACFFLASCSSLSAPKCGETVFLQSAMRMRERMEGGQPCRRHHWEEEAAGEGKGAPHAVE